MLTLQDCIGLSDFTPEQIEAIADHQHMEMIVAAEWAESVLERPDGCEIIRRILAERASHCRAQGDLAKSKAYQACLEEFNNTHGGQRH